MSDGHQGLYVEEGGTVGRKEDNCGVGSRVPRSATKWYASSGFETKSNQPLAEMTLMNASKRNSEWREKIEGNFFFFFSFPFIL